MKILGDSDTWDDAALKPVCWRWCAWWHSVIFPSCPLCNSHHDDIDPHIDAHFRVYPAVCRLRREPHQSVFVAFASKPLPRNKFRIPCAFTTLSLAVIWNDSNPLLHASLCKGAECQCSEWGVKTIKQSGFLLTVLPSVYVTVYVQIRIWRENK